MKLHVIKGRSRTLQEAVAHATEVDAVDEAENKAHRHKGDGQMVGAAEVDLAEEVRVLHEDLAKTSLRVLRGDQGRNPPEMMDATIVGRRVISHELAPRGRKMDKEMSPGGWTKK